MNTLSLTKPALRTAYKVDGAMTKLENVADVFGLDKLVDGIDDLLDNFCEAEMEWASQTVDDWFDSAPWRTGNLRESIDYNAENLLKLDVGIDKQTLMKRAGQELPAKRKAYDGEKFKITGHSSYPEWVDANVTRYGEEWSAVSASATADPIEPTANREYNKFTHTPFIDEIWFVLAHKNKKEIFG